MGTLSGKVAVVTGCGRPLGMGEAIALKLAEEGARVSICDLCRPITEDLGLDRDLVNRTLGGWEHLEGVVRRIEELGSQGRAFKTDVGDKAEELRLEAELLLKQRASEIEEKLRREMPRQVEQLEHWIEALKKEIGGEPEPKTTGGKGG